MLQEKKPGIGMFPGLNDLSREELVQEHRMWESGQAHTLPEAFQNVKFNTHPKHFPGESFAATEARLTPDHVIPRS